ncbi:hypothetical protein Tco_0221409 [Tanacetum coccineum]
MLQSLIDNVNGMLRNKQLLYEDEDDDLDCARLEGRYPEFYVTAGSTAHQRYSPSGFFFGVSAIALAINMLFICRMVFNGNGLDVDEYVRIAYKFPILTAL